MICLSCLELYWLFCRQRTLFTWFAVVTDNHAQVSLVGHSSEYLAIHVILALGVLISKVHHTALLGIEGHTPGAAPGFQIFNDTLHFIRSFAVIDDLCNLSIVCKFGHDALFVAETFVYVVDVDYKKNGSQHRPLDDRADHVPPFGVFPIHQYPLFSLTQPVFNPQNDFIGEVESFELL